MQKLVLYASEIAACAGKHKYQKQHEAFEKVWRRVAPQSFEDALRRNAKKTKEDVVAELAQANPHVRSVLESARTAVHASSTAVAHHPQGGLEGLTPEENALVGEAVRTSLFTGYGTRQESSVLEALRTEFGYSVRTDDTFFKKQIGEVGDGVPRLS